MGLPNRLKDEGSTVVAFLGTQLLNTEAMGFRYEAGARYDWRTNSFGVVWNTTDVERGDQLLAAGLMFVGAFGVISCEEPKSVGQHHLVNELMIRLMPLGGLANRHPLVLHKSC